MLAGLPKSPPGATERANRATDWPNLGSVLAYARPSPPDLPTAVVLPTKLTFDGYSFPGQNAGFLGAQYDPWHLEGDPNDPELPAPVARPPRGPEPLPRGRARRPTRRGRGPPPRPRTRRRVGHAARRLPRQGRRAAGLTTARATPSTSTREDPRLRERYGRNMMGQGAIARPPAGRGGRRAGSGQPRRDEPLGHAFRQLQASQGRLAPPSTRASPP